LSVSVFLKLYPSKEAPGVGLKVGNRTVMGKQGSEKKEGEQVGTWLAKKMSEKTARSEHMGGNGWLSEWGTR